MGGAPGDRGPPASPKPRPHKSLANPHPRTPAVAAGLADQIWTCEQIAALLD
jgi:hypothetical protein